MAKSRDPYAVWISESMLQQTQVSTVVGYFERFLNRFPKVTDLARADEQEVLALWAGLGYYRRARQLHAAAKKVVQEFEGVFPDHVEQLMTLPGVGRYTAGAIASIAHGQPAPIVEANTERLFARLLLLKDDLRAPRSNSLLWQFAQWLVDATDHHKTADHKTADDKTADHKTGAETPLSVSESVSRSKKSKASRTSRTSAITLASVEFPRFDAGHINQAAMELGSLICKPQAPMCLVCPLIKHCPTAQAGLQQVIPAPKARPTFTPLHHVALVIRQANTKTRARKNRAPDVSPEPQYLMRMNPEGAWWTGLWDFPRVDVTALTLRSLERSKPAAKWLSSEKDWKRIEQAASLQLALDVKIDGLLKSMSHGVTRYRITLDCFAGSIEDVPDGMRWVSPAQSSTLPLTATAKKMMIWLASK